MGATMATLLLSSKEFANATETTLHIRELSAFVIRGVARAQLVAEHLIGPADELYVYR